MKDSQRGVTLLELLVAVSLVALLSLGMSLALRISLNSSQRAQEHIDRDRRVLGVDRVLREQLANLVPTAVNCEEGNDTNLRRTLPMFEGQPDEMRFVSTYSLHEGNRGLPQLLEFKIIPGADGEGVRLIVNERPWTGLGSRLPLCLGVVPGEAGDVGRFPPVEASPASFVLADRLRSCHIRYHQLRRPPEWERWSDVWTEAFAWPSAIEVAMEPLVHDQSRLELATVTVPLRVNRDIRKRPDE